MSIRKFREPDLFHSPAAAREVEKDSFFVDRIVLGSLAGSALAAILLFIYFIRSINRGIVSVVENTDRFRQGEELKQPLPGADELAKLDQAFHAMATEIREAQNTKKAVLAMISHDLRTPLMSVLALFSVLQVYLQDASAAALAGAQQQEADIQQLIRLITDLLDLEKIEAGSLSLQLRTVSVNEAVSRAIATIEPFAELKGLIVRGIESDLQILADPDRIVQAIGCLLAAAIKVSPRGSVVETNVVQDGNEVEIKVTSLRADITADVLESMFDRYGERTAGLGLELPLGKEIIRLHNGKIGVASEQPKGCTLWFSLANSCTDLSTSH